jgi:ATP-binding cassette subfamily F protein uup
MISYLSDFLFSPERARTPVKALSGGECNRVLLAKLFSKAANILVLDEPTNDLDIETLELLEEIILDFDGTILLVSHDRTFLDSVVTSTLAFEGEGVVQEYVGGYQDWLRQRPEKVANDKAKDTVSESSTSKLENAVKPGKKKLSYKLQRELEALPAQIEAAEERLEALQAQTSAADFYQQAHDEVASVLAEMATQEEELELLMERWIELEAMQEA